jgi:hypothetical protein
MFEPFLLSIATPNGQALFSPAIDGCEATLSAMSLSTAGLPRRPPARDSSQVLLPVDEAGLIVGLSHAPTLRISVGLTRPPRS